MKEDHGDASFDWLAPLKDGLEESDQLIREASLEDGWEIVRHRGALIRSAMEAFFMQAIQDVPPRGDIAIHSLGGTGRQELCPDSDIDIGIIFENEEENGHFIDHVKRQFRIASSKFPKLQLSAKGNSIHHIREGQYFDITSFASLLDADLLVGDFGFDQRIRSVCQERAAELGLEFIFHVNNEFRDFDRLYRQEPGDVGGFEVKKGKGGLRNFQFTMWLYSFERWIPSVQVYEQAQGTRRFDSEGAPTPQVLEAVGILFSARCWIAQRREEQLSSGVKGRRPARTIEVEDMKAFIERFGDQGLAQLNRARRTVYSYREETMDRLLAHGVVVPELDGLVVWGTNGLRLAPDAFFGDSTKLFYSVYRAQQEYGLEIDKSVKRAARRHIAQSLRQDAAFIKLMSMKKPICPALKDWFEYGVLGRMLPHFDVLANRLYGSKHRAATLTLAARAIQRVESLEGLAELRPSQVSPGEAYFVHQYQSLGVSGRCALRLALLCEEIPEHLYQDKLDYEQAVSRYVDESLSKVLGLSGPTLRTVEFLLLMKRDLLEDSETSDHQQVLQRWRERIDAVDSRDAADTVRALALFTYAAFDFHGVLRDRLEREQWSNIQNLTQNLLYDVLGIKGDAYDKKYLMELEERIGALLPPRLLASPHVDNKLKPNEKGVEVLDPTRTHRLIYAIRDVVQSGAPKVELQREQQYFRLAVIAWEFPGLFWRVAEVLYESACSIRTTDLYGFPDPNGKAADGEAFVPGERRLVYDVITFDALQKTDDAWGSNLIKRIRQRLESSDEQIIDKTSEILEPVMPELFPKLTDLGDGLLKFSYHAPEKLAGTRYAMSRILAEKAGGSIDSIVPDGTRDWDVPRTNFYIRSELDVHQFAETLRSVLGEIIVRLDKQS